MKPFEVDIRKSAGASTPLPAGAYNAVIMGAEVKDYSWGSQLVVSFDIADGEHKGHFAENYRANTNDDRKWKGNYRLTIPQPGNQWYDSQKRAFGNAIYCWQESNPGYKWDWEESKLKGKHMGVLFRDKEWEMEGKTGMTTECCAILTTADVKEGNFKIPKPKLLKNHNEPVVSAPAYDAPVDSDEDDLPF